MLENVMNAGDMGIIERGSAPRFVEEMLSILRVVSIMRSDALQGHLTVELRVHRAIDLAHTTGPKSSPNLVSPNEGTCQIDRIDHGVRGLGVLFHALKASTRPAPVARSLFLLAL